MSDWYNRDGRRITIEEWVRVREGEGVVVARTEVEDATVSTVWLGLDHSFGSGPPLIFETLVFGGPLAEEMARYSTEQQAREGHAAMVADVKRAYAEAKP